MRTCGDRLKPPRPPTLSPFKRGQRRLRHSPFSGGVSVNFTKQLLAFVSLFSALGFGQASIQNGVTPPTLSGGSVSSIAASCAPATIAIGQTAQCSGTAFVQNNPTNDVTNI